MERFLGRNCPANWRVMFRFDDGAEEVDYVDYH